MEKSGKWDLFLIHLGLIVIVVMILAYTTGALARYFAGGERLDGLVFLICFLAGLIVFIEGFLGFLSKKKKERSKTDLNREKRTTGRNKISVPDVKSITKEKGGKIGADKGWGPLKKDKTLHQEKNETRQKTPRRKLKELQVMKENDLITKEDFEKKKKEILDNY